MSNDNLHLGACIVQGRLHATVMRRNPDSTITVVATAEMDEASLRGQDCHALMQAAPKDQPEWDRVYGLLRHWSQRAQGAEDALQGLVALHDEPAGFVGKFGKALDEAVEKRAAAVERAMAKARDVLAQVP